MVGQRRCRRPGYGVVIDAESEIVTVEQFERMSPQQRADVVSRSTIRSLDDVSEGFRREIQETALRLGAQRRKRA